MGRPLFPQNDSNGFPDFENGFPILDLDLMPLEFKLRHFGHSSHVSHSP